MGRTLLNELRVIGQLGAGGMGAVYEVEHLITKHHRALEVLHPAHCESHETVARFVREAGVAGTLRSPYVVETFDAGQLEDGSAYVLMELLEGIPLAEHFERESPASPGRVVGIACQVLEGLASALSGLPILGAGIGVLAWNVVDFDARGVPRWRETFEACRAWATGVPDTGCAQRFTDLGYAVMSPALNGEQHADLGQRIAREVDTYNAILAASIAGIALGGAALITGSSS